MNKKAISVIIPVLNEEDHIGDLLDQLKDIDVVSEIVVADGGSKDNTEEIVLAYSKVSLVNSDKGRGIQMNTGAEKATSDFLLFLHADSKLSNELIERFSKIIEKGDPAAFAISFDCDHWLYRLYSNFSKLNWSIFTYGDQGLFIPRSLFQKLQGFKNIPIMEDLDMVRRIKSHTAFTKYSCKIITSSRRFERNGVLWQQITNILLVIAFYFGVSPHFLSRFYRY